MSYNSLTNDWDSTITYIAFNGTSVASSSIAFGPDGTTGYIVLFAASPDYGVTTVYAPFVSKSTDGGLTWTVGQNITANAYGLIGNRENVFASAAKRADNFLHLIYQEDDLPGTNLQNNGTSNAHPNNEQMIMYKAIPVQDILNNTIGDIVSVNKQVIDPKIFFVSQNQPNPASSETVAFLYMRDGSDITLTLSDITGKVIKTENLGYHAAGNNSISINADGLTSGLYLYTVSNNQYSITKKMQVK